MSKPNRTSLRNYKSLKALGLSPTDDVSFTVDEEFIADGDSLQIWPATAAFFLGPKAENEELLKKLVSFSIDQHVDFRKFKYFPLDPNYITENIKNSDSYKKAICKLEEELGGLTSRLKNSVPFFNFRSQGHMLWDTTLAANIGYIAALFYNQNNVASMASGVTLQLEREVAKDLCKMVGYNIGEDQGGQNQDIRRRQGGQHQTKPLSWGHLPNGGTVANLEAMWAARSLKYNGLTLQKMMAEKFVGELEVIRDSFAYTNLAGEEVLLKNASAWDLLNIPIDEAIDMFDNLLNFIQESEICNEQLSFDDLFTWIKDYTYEELGSQDFFQAFSDELCEASVMKSAVWFVPGSRHYSWDKAANVLGIGRRNLIKIPVDKYCRLDMKSLNAQLLHCLKNRIAVIGVTVVFGTTQEGAVDDLNKLLIIRKKFESENLTFYIHIDGAWGGYFASVMRHPQEWDIKSSHIAEQLKRQSTVFLQANLSKHFQLQLECIQEANSITMDPHKSGFCPYPAGGLLYRNGNIRKFLAQKAAYVSHGSGSNEEINLFGLDGSKPGAASAGVWLSHKVIGLHKNGYGLLLEQCTFSAGIMYALWCSLERSVDPFLVVPAIPIQDKFKNSWPKSRIRKEILQAENWSLQTNKEALEFMNENGPDTLINCLSINVRSWDEDAECWVPNSDPEIHKKFVQKFYKRCSHSFERPSMVDRGIQIILNSTSWSMESHTGSYLQMKNSLGLSEAESGNLSMIINTCMSPWLRAQKTFKRIGLILRNELYNAHGAIFDKPEQLQLVSPCVINDQEWKGDIFAELEASFVKPALRYHAIGRFMFPSLDTVKIQELAKQCYDLEQQDGKPRPLRIITQDEMTVFELMTGGDKNNHVNQPMRAEPDLGDKNNLINQPMRAEPTVCRPSTQDDGTLNKKLEEYSDEFIEYDDIAMPAIPVTVHFGSPETHKVESFIKIKRIIRYHHLQRDSVDEKDYPPSQEYFLYADNQNAYISHCPNRFPDFQQQIRLDEVPSLGLQDDENSLYQEALRRGVVIYLPQVENGGRPLLSQKKPGKCRDPLKDHLYNAVSWSDQGAFTGDMHSIYIKFYSQFGKRWFSGEKMNEGYSRSSEPYLYTEDGERRDLEENNSEDSEDEN